MNYSIEVLRLIAIILITFTHTKHNLVSGNFYFIIEEVPKYGTPLLSIISGYLYWKTINFGKSIIPKKINTLLIPFFISNTIIVILSIIVNYAGYNFLNRLPYNSALIYEGIFSLNTVPINPPTYFIRDLFVVFALSELFLKKNYKMLLLIIPLLIFGKLILRYDILIMFGIGIFIASLKFKKRKIILAIGLFIFSILSFLFIFEYFKYFFATLIFILVVDIPIKFYKTGGYSYILHLYHAPIIVASIPIYKSFIKNDYWLIILQILTAYALSLILFYSTKKYKFLKIISGGR